MTEIPFVVVQADRLPTSTPVANWLIDKLWSAEAVGLIGGPPKSCKTWLALEMAYSVASGSPCPGAFPVLSPGPVVIYNAEDALPALHERLSCLAHTRGHSLSGLPVSVIQAERIRLDNEDDRKRLTHTVQTHKPRLLILDPLVRLHGCDENNASEVARLLGYLRRLQRVLHISVLMTHHARKCGTVGASLGSALRGTNDLWAWGDSNLYLQRMGRDIHLTVEHRSAPSSSTPIRLRLADEDAKRIHLQVLGPTRTSGKEHSGSFPQQATVKRMPPPFPPPSSVGTAPPPAPRRTSPPDSLFPL